MTSRLQSATYPVAAADPDDNDLTWLRDFLRDDLSGRHAHAGFDGPGLSAVVDGTAGNDFIHVGGDGLTPPAGYGDLALATDTDDTITTGDGNDIVYAGNGNDTVYAGKGTDALYGGLGNDTIKAVNEGVYSIYGGDGNDTIEVNSTNGAPGSHTNPHLALLDAGDGDDTAKLTDSSGTTLVVDIAGLHGGTGADTLDIGSWVTFAGTGAFSAAATGFEHLIYSGIFSIGGDSANNTFDLSGFVIDGTSPELNFFEGNDTAIGNDAIADHFHGDLGDDVLSGGGGNDALFGDGGDDILTGGAGVDSIYGGDFGTDTAVYFGNSADFTFTQGDNGIIHIDGPDAGEYLSGIELVKFDDKTVVLADLDFSHTLTGTSGNDTLNGGFDDDKLYGLEGNDHLFGGNGADEIYGGPGNDELYGGEGNNILDGGTGNDKFFGGNGDETITAGGGTDTIYGGGGNDTLILAGTFSQYDIVRSENLIYTATGPDGVATFQNIRWLQFDDQTVDPSMISQDRTLTGTINDDVLRGGVGDDHIYGLAGNDKLFGGSGSDFLNGGDGNDTLKSDSGMNETLLGGQGDDVISVETMDAGTLVDGGAGNDVIHLDGGLLSVAAVRGGHGIDTVVLEDDISIEGDFSASIAGFELLQTKGNAIYGGDGSNVIDLSGFAGLLGVHVSDLHGTDTLIGTAGNDDLYDPSRENDVLMGLDGNDTLEAQGTIDGGSGDDTITSYGGIVYGGAGNDSISATGVFSVFDTGDGDDVVTFQTGADLSGLSGGAGLDTLKFENSYARAIHGAVFSAAASGFENLKFDSGAVLHTDDGGVLFDFSGFTLLSNGVITVLAGSGNDTIIGSALRDSFNGGDGKDVLQGLDGTDILFGSTGVDKLYGGTGDDAIDGGDGRDMLDGGDGLDTFAFTGGHDSLRRKFDTIVGFDAASDKLDLSLAVTVDQAITAGSLSRNSFLPDLQSALASLQAGHAVLFTPDAGSYAGETFLVVNRDGVAGYGITHDLVVRLHDPIDALNLTDANFI